MEIYAKGKRGIVFLEEKNGIKIAVKIKNPKSDAINRLQNEANFLELLNTHNIGPKFISFENNELRMEFIDGERIIDYLEKKNRNDVMKTINDVIQQMIILDKLGINKYEMTNPYKHILVRKTDNKPVLIDFERCRKTLKPKNITQFMQFLTNKKIKNILEKKGLNINSAEMIKKMQDYKKTKKIPEIL